MGPNFHKSKKYVLLVVIVVSTNSMGIETTKDCDHEKVISGTSEAIEIDPNTPKNIKDDKNKRAGNDFFGLFKFLIPYSFR